MCGLFPGFPNNVVSHSLTLLMEHHPRCESVKLHQLHDCAGPCVPPAVISCSCFCCHQFHILNSQYIASGSHSFALMSCQVMLFLHLIMSPAARYWPHEDLPCCRMTSMVLFNCMSSVSVTVSSNSLWAGPVSLISCFSFFWETHVIFYFCLGGSYDLFEFFLSLLISSPLSCQFDLACMQLVQLLHNCF